MHSYALYVRYCNKNILSFQTLCQQLIFHLLFRYNEATNKKQIKKKTRVQETKNPAQPNMYSLKL